MFEKTGSIIGYKPPTMIGRPTANNTQTVEVFLPEQIQKRDKIFMPLMVLLYGPRGSFKSGTMTVLCALQRRRMISHGFHVSVGGQWKLASNIDIRYADIADPLILNDVINMEDWVQYWDLFYDEIQNDMSARRSMAGQNVGFSHASTQIRKMDMDFLGNTQKPQTLDQQLLMQLDLVGEVTSWETYDEYTETLARAITIYFHDFWGAWTNDMRKHKVMPPPRSEFDWKFHLYVPDAYRTIYGQYPTKMKSRSSYASAEVQGRIVASQWGDRKIRSAKQEKELAEAKPEKQDAGIVLASDSEDAGQLFDRMGKSFQFAAFYALLVKLPKYSGMRQEVVKHEMLETTFGCTVKKTPNGVMVYKP